MMILFSCEFITGGFNSHLCIPEKVILFYEAIHIRDFMRCQHTLIVCLHSLNYLLSALEIIKLHFSLLCSKGMQFNRAVFYSSWILHSLQWNWKWELNVWFYEKQWQNVRMMSFQGHTEVKRELSPIYFS